MSQKKKAKTDQSILSSIGFYFHIIVSVIKSLVLLVVSLIVLGAALGAGIGAGYFAYLVQDTKPPTKEELQHDLGDITETSRLAYNDNQTIATIRSDLLRTSVQADEISDLIKDAVIATEDENFHIHNGIVPKAIIRALVSEVAGLGSSGGSTLTQQLVKQQILTSETTFRRKANEILLAMEVERNFSKEEILVMYLNVSPFGRNNMGQNIAGVQEAAQGIFGVDASDVNLPQAAFIAGLPQSPIVFSPFTNTGELQEDLSLGLARKDFVLFSMYRNHKITREEYEEALAYDLVADFKEPETIEQEDFGFLYDIVMENATNIIAQKLAEASNLSEESMADPEIFGEYLNRASVRLANGGYTVKTTIDRDIYQAMQQAVADYGYLLDDGSRIEVGNVLMENTTGRILGFVGGRDYATNQFNHAFSSQRQAGSAIKPVLVYASAIDQGLMGTESRVSDFPTTWQTGSDAGTPIVNAGYYGSKTFQTVRESIIHSTNIPAYHIYQNTLNHMGSTSAVFDTYLQKMNFPNVDSWQFESAPLGVTEITTLAQTNGFQTLANNGIFQEGYLIESIIDNQGNVLYEHQENPVQVFSRATASIVVDLMRSVISVGQTTAFESNVRNLSPTLANADWVGKTGTTDNDVDSWLVVSTPTITLSSWSGREDSQPTSPGSGQRTGLYMARLANAIYQANPEVMGTDKQFTLDPSVIAHEVSKYTGTKPGGKVTVNNTNFEAPKETITSYWAKGGPAEVSFKFGIGGTEANYTDYWKKVIPKKEEPKEEEKKDDDKDDDDEDDKDDDNDDNNNRNDNRENNRNNSRNNRNNNGDDN